MESIQPVCVCKALLLTTVFQQIKLTQYQLSR